MDENKIAVPIKLLIDALIERIELKIVTKKISFQIDNKIDKQNIRIIIDSSLIANLISEIIDIILFSTESGFIKIFFEVMNKNFIVSISNSGQEIFYVENKRILHISNLELLKNDLEKQNSIQNIQNQIVQLNAQLEYKLSNLCTPLLKIFFPCSFLENNFKNEDYEKKKIMIVDDELLNVILIEEFVKELNCKVVKAFNALEALENVQKEDFDAIIMDFKMPKMNGIDLSEKIFEIKPNIPIIIVSAYIFELQEQIKTANIKSIIPKPVRQKELLETIKNLLN